MRLVACALSTVLLSGCSWFGMGGGHGDIYGYDNYGYGYGTQAHGAYGQQSYAGYGYNQDCGQSAGVQYYGVASTGCAPGQGYAVAQSGAQYGYGGATTLSQSAPYGSAVGGSVQTVQGAPMYVQQPYASYQTQNAAYYGGGAPALRGSINGAHACCYGGGAAAPFGIEAGIGTDFSIGGDIFNGEVSKPFLGGPGTVSDLDPISYADAYGNAVTYDLAATYDLNRNTTLIGQLGYSKASGEQIKVGTVNNGLGVSEDLFAEFSDLEQLRVEGGLRRYMGHGGYGGGLRPYVGATAGFVSVKDVELTQSSTTLVDPTLFTQTYVDGGWHPTASGTIGAEWQAGPRTALGIETGIRWRDDLDTNISSDDQWSIPLKIRGRVSF